MRRFIVVLLGVMLLIPAYVYAAASFQVTAFSCNPNEVKVSDQFTCTASVQNTGDASGTLNTATLYPDADNWLQSSSYPVTVNTAIGSGALTEVTFNGLRGTKAGDNGFSRIMLDDVTDTYVADNSVNVNVINVIVTDSKSASSAAASSTVDVTAQATSGGNIDVVLSFSVTSGGCSIGNQASSATTNDMTDGQTASHTWTVTMSTSTCSYSVSAQATSNPSGTVSKTDSASGSITCSSGCTSSNEGTSSSSSSGSGGGGGGGGGGSGGNESMKEQVWAEVLAGSTVTLTVSNSKIAVSSIVVSIKNAIKNFKLSVKALDAKPIDANEFDGVAYQYLQLSKENAADSDIESVKIKFNVKKSWVEENGVDLSSIVLYRYLNNQWEKISTTALDADDNNLKFEAVSSGVGYFVIGAVKQVQQTEQQPASSDTTTPNVEIESDSDAQQKGGLVRKIFENKSVNMAIIGAVVVFGLFIAGYLVYQRRNKGK